MKGAILSDLQNHFMTTHIPGTRSKENILKAGPPCGIRVTSTPRSASQDCSSATKINNTCRILGSFWFHQCIARLRLHLTCLWSILTMRNCDSSLIPTYVIGSNTPTQYLIGISRTKHSITMCNTSSNLADRKRVHSLKMTLYRNTYREHNTRAGMRIHGS